MHLKTGVGVRGVANPKVSYRVFVVFFRPGSLARGLMGRAGRHRHRAAFYRGWRGKG